MLVHIPRMKNQHFLLEDIAAVLEHCTAQEARIIADIAKAAKRSLDKHR